MMQRRFTIPALLMSGVLVFTACGDDDDDAAGGSGGSSVDYCAVARDASAAFDSLSAESTPEDVEDVYNEVADAIDSVSGNVPAEIADAFELNAERFEAARAAFAAADFDPAAVDTQALEEFETEEYSAATDAVDLYDTEVCGIEG